MHLPHLLADLDDVPADLHDEAVFDAFVAWAADRGLTEFLLAHYADFFARRGAGAATDLSADTMAAIAALDDVIMVGAGTDGTLESVALFDVYQPQFAYRQFMITFQKSFQ